MEAAWRKGDGPWVPVSRVCTNDACREDPTVPTGRPFDLAWDAAALESGWYDLQLSFCDRSGNRSTAARHVLVSREPPALRVLGTLRPVFSPNGDGRLDDTVASVRLAGAVRLNAEVRRGSPTGPLVRTLFSDRPYDATDVAVPWDGRDAGGAPAADGLYAVVFSAADACGSSSTVFVPVTVDTAPPVAAITEPAGMARVAGTVDVRGQATDPHLATWHLDVACGAEPWTILEARGTPVASGELLSRWDTSRGPPGDCRSEARRGGRSRQRLRRGRRPRHRRARRPHPPPLGQPGRLLAQRRRSARDRATRRGARVAVPRLARGPRRVRADGAPVRAGRGARGRAVVRRVGWPRRHGRRRPGRGLHGLAPRRGSGRRVRVRGAKRGPHARPDRARPHRDPPGRRRGGGGGERRGRLRRGPAPPPVPHSTPRPRRAWSSPAASSRARMPPSPASLLSPTDRTRWCCPPATERRTRRAARSRSSSTRGLPAPPSRALRPESS